MIKTIKIKNLTNVFIKKIIRYHEFFTFIIIDRDSLFTFEYYSFLCYILKIKKKRLRRFIFKLMNKRNVKTISWNNIFEHMSISFKIIEFFYFLWSNSFTTMRTIFQSIFHRSKQIWIKIFAWFSKKISISNFEFRISIALNQSKKLRQFIVVLKINLLKFKKIKFNSKINEILFACTIETTWFDWMSKT